MKFAAYRKLQGDFCSIIAWKTISDAEKAPFVAKYKENSEIYEKSLIKWEDKMLKQVSIIFYGKTQLNYHKIFQIVHNLMHCVFCREMMI